MKSTAMAVLMLMVGCSPRLRVGSPQFQRAPELICIVVIEGEPDSTSADVAETAISACRGATENQTKEQIENKKL
jgi:hypothetical protein